MKVVKARWRVHNIQDLEDLEEIHVSCGVFEKQFEPYDITSEGAEITIKKLGVGYSIEFKAASCDLETNNGYWLSPNVVCREEPIDFEIAEDK